MMVLRYIIIPILCILFCVFMILNSCAEESYPNKVLYAVMAGFFFFMLMVSAR